VSFVKSKLFLISLVLLLSSGGVLFSEEAFEWIGGYSSQEWEGGESDQDETKTYYQWQIDSLKKAVSPRYIRLLDIHEYASSGKILNRGILFTYTGLRNKSVFLCGNFSQWECIPMRKNRFGIFYSIVPPTATDENYQQITTYNYKFKVDGIYLYDPENPEQEKDGSGSYLSTYYLEKVDKDKFASSQILEDSNEEEENLRTVLFRAYLPDKETVSVTGNFNNWNYDTDYLKKNPDGTFEIKIKLLPGIYHYQFIADGEILVDTYNPNVKIREPFEELVSEIKVPNRKEPLERKY
jgi:hypothetical protein